MDAMFAVLCVVGGFILIYLGFQFLDLIKYVNEFRTQIPGMRQSVQDINSQIDDFRLMLAAHDDKIDVANEFSANFNSLYEKKNRK